MQKPFSRFAFWLTALVTLVIGMFGFAMPALFNMDSDLMFIALPVALLAFAVAAWWMASRLVRAAMALRRTVDDKISF